MVVLMPPTGSEGDSNEPFGIAMDAAWRVEEIAVPNVRMARTLFSETMQEFIFGQVGAFLFVTTLRVQAGARARR